MLLVLGRLSSSFEFLGLLARQSNADQQTIEKMVAATSSDRRNAMRAEAEIALKQINHRMAERFLFHEESKAAERAIELLVCVEAIEKGKGWWFRSKRRLQLTQAYLGGAAPKPYSVIIKEQVNDDAVKLMTLTDLALTKYLSMSQEELMEALPLDFPGDHFGFDLDAVTFVFASMSDFYFTLSENNGSKVCVLQGEEDTQASHFLFPFVGTGIAPREKGSPLVLERRRSLSG